MSELFLDTTVKFQMFRKANEVHGRVIIPKSDWVLVSEDAEYYYLAVQNELSSEDLMHMLPVHANQNTKKEI